MNDVLELLLPDVPEARLATARRWTSFMRLVFDDARAERADSVGVDRASAAEVLRDHERTTLSELLFELLAAHVSTHLEAGGRGDFVRGLLVDAERSSHESWIRLLELRDCGGALPALPAPGEPALDVARRLFDALESYAGESRSLEVQTWRVWLTLAESEGAPKDVEEADRALAALRGPAQDTFTPTELALLVRASAALHLERGRVRAAAALLAENAELVLADERLLELRMTTSLLLGDAAEARALAAARSPRRRANPHPARALSELARRIPSWRELLPPPDRPQDESGGTRSASTALMTRADVGAAFLAVFRTESGDLPSALHVEVSPGWGTRLDAWLDGRDGACSTPTRPEHELLKGARTQIEHRLPGEAPLRDALGGEETRARVLLPLLEEGGGGRREVSAWVHLEFEHHLVPTSARLAALAGSWRRKARGSRGEGETGFGAVALRDGVASDSDPRARFFAELVEALGMKVAKRRWWGLVSEGSERVIVATGGGTLDDWEEYRGGARVLGRAALSRGPVVFDASDTALSVSARAGSGLCLPLVDLAETVGFLAVESERRRDFRDRDAARYRTIVQSRAELLRIARFRAWHVDRFGHDLHFDVNHEGFGRRALDVTLAGRSVEPVVISGPRGAGKETLARWLCFESELRGDPVHVARCAVEPEDALTETIETRLERRAAVSETLIVKDLDELPRRLQARLHAALEQGGRSGLRLVFTLQTGLAEALARGSLLAPLAHRLERIELFVPALTERRAEIPGLAFSMGERFAAARGVSPPEWDDEAVAVLWRQPWPGNVRELESLVYKLVLLHPERRVGTAELQSLAGRFRAELVRRLPSRHPERADVVDALRTTLKQSGNVNKTRAALYLGWDPDTLSARLRDLDLDPGELSSVVETPREGSTRKEQGSASPKPD